MALALQAIPGSHRPHRRPGRPRLEGIRRPRCPLGHDSAVQLNGYVRSRSTAHERPRYRCVPYDGSRPHRFTPAMPTRHERHAGHGPAECEACERPIARFDGPRTGHAYEFAVREIATALIRLGESKSYRDASAGLRSRIGKRSRKKGYTSHEAGTAIGYLDAFGELVVAAERVAEWPPIIVVDAQPFRERVPSGTRRKRRLPWPQSSRPTAPRAHPRKPIRLRRKGAVKERGLVFVAMGQTRPFERPFPVLLRFMGGRDEVCWREFFETLPGTPRWIVSDRDGGIMNAVKAVWTADPPIHYFCHVHLAKNAADTARKDDHVPPGHLIYDMLEALPADPGNAFPALQQAARDLPAPALAKWLADNRALLFAQQALRATHPDHPRSNGAAETLLTKVRHGIRDRVPRLRNAARLDRLLALIAVQEAGRASEQRYAAVLRDWFVAHDGGRGIAWRALQDPRGVSSIDRLVAEAQARSRAAKARRASAQKARRYRAKRHAYVARRVAQGLPAAPQGRPRVVRAARGSVAGKTVADFGWLVATWHPTRNGTLRPGDVPAGTGTSVWWRCDRGDDHEWQAQVRSRTIQGTGCPFCAHKRVAPSESLATTHPDVAATWHLTRNGTKTPADFTYGSHHEAWWQCPRYATHVWRARIASRTVMLAGCPSCALAEGKGARPKGSKRELGEVIELPRREEPSALPETGDA
jgi:hypothetical protein